MLVAQTPASNFMSANSKFIHVKWLSTSSPHVAAAWLTNVRNNHFTDTLHSSMVPGILPSQFEIFSMGQIYLKTCLWL